MQHYMKPLTIEKLKKACEEQIKKGNGKKVIMISSDDEGNNYHYLWYSFLTIEDYEKPTEYNGETYSFPFDYCNEEVAKKNNTIILG